MKLYPANILFILEHMYADVDVCLMQTMNESSYDYLDIFLVLPQVCMYLFHPMESRIPGKVSASIICPDYTKSEEDISHKLLAILWLGHT